MRLIENQFNMPDYLVFLILGNIKELRRVSPNHILVRAVSDALDRLPDKNPNQLCFPF